MQDSKSKWARRTWFPLSESPNYVYQLKITIRLYQNCNINAGPATVWLQMYYMHLCCAHVLPWSVCAKSAQH